jgi:hypothetical protein
MINRGSAVKYFIRAIGLFAVLGVIAMCAGISSNPKSMPAAEANPAGWVNKDSAPRENTIPTTSANIGKYTVKEGFKSVPWQDRLQPYFLGIARETGDKTCHESIYASGGYRYYVTWCWPSQGEATITNILRSATK